MSSRRSCACQNRLHEHGCYLRYASQNTLCHCPECTTAWSLYSRRRRIAKAAVAYGIPDPAACKQLTDATGTVRRLQALAVMGWSSIDVAQRLDRYHGDLRSIRNGVWPRVRQETADAVSAIYDELSMRPSTNRKKAWLSSRARRRGWVSPLAWDNIDDPDEKPNLGDPRAPINQVDEIAVARAMDGDPPRPFRDVDKREAINRLHALGLTNHAIATRLRMRRPAVEQHFARSRRAQKEGEAA